MSEDIGLSREQIDKEIAEDIGLQMLAEEQAKLDEGKGNLEAVRKAIARAEKIAPVDPQTPDKTDNSAPPARETKRKVKGVKDPKFPVVPLGINGEVCFYLDATRQLRALRARDHSRLGITSLFGAETHVLYDAWPRYTKDLEINGWKQDQAAEDLMASAANCGVWNALEKVRGAGAWVGEDGQLIMHCGDKILESSMDDDQKFKWHKPGLIGKHVYPAAPAVPRPKPSQDGEGIKEVKWLYNTIQTWKWRRPDVDPILLLGWIGCAVLSGALDWRPLIWTTGDRGTGKSTLHELISKVMGEALVAVTDASAAGIWQKLGHAALPVELDELEAEEDNRKSQNVIGLARQAASGGVVLRGGADHQSSEFAARSCFLFSSILLPPTVGAR